MERRTPSTPTEPLTLQERVQRLVHRPGALIGWFRRRPKAALVGLLSASITALAVPLAAWMVTAPSHEEDYQQRMAKALEQLDDAQFDRAQATAAALREHSTLSYEQLGGPMFVLGVALAHDATSHWNDEQKGKLFLVAARYLEDARARGFPEGRTGDGLFLLGRCLFQAGRYAECLPVLHDALEFNPNRRVEILNLLQRGYRNDAPPQWQPALQFNQLYLASESLTSNQRDQARLDQAEIRLAMGEIAEAGRALDQLSPNSSLKTAGEVIRARIQLEQASQALLNAAMDRAAAEQQLRDAINNLRTVLESSNDDALRRQAQFLMGRGYRILGDDAAAEAQFSRTRRLFFQTPEALAASLEEAELQLASGRPDVALASFQRVLHDAGEPLEFHNRWLDVDSLRRRILSAYTQYLGRQQFEQAISLAKSLEPIFPKATSVQLQADAYRQFAQAREAEAHLLPVPQAAAQRAEARQKWREAGSLFSKLAELQIMTRSYPDDLWNSAESFWNGQNYEVSAVMLQKYLEHATRAMRPRALVLQGRCYTALDRPEQALPPLLECIEFFPTHPATYQSRLAAAQVFLEAGKLEEAKALLQDNLHNESLTPDSLEWRDSLFALGLIEYREGKELETKSRLHGASEDEDQRKASLRYLEDASVAFRQATRTLTEAIQRYPNAPQTTEAVYRVGEAHRNAARLPRKMLADESIETVRSVLNRQIKEHLNAAIIHYALLQNQLNEKQERLQLTDVENTILRNCYFAQADALFDLADFEQAIQAYSTATNRYQSEPEALEAFVQIAACYRRLDRPRDARGTLEQAKVVLGRIRPDADFTKTTRFDRENWLRLLDWLTSF